MKPIIFRTVASADMRRIARETRDAWGTEQAYKYSTRLSVDIKSLVKFPMRFPAVESRPDVRRMNSGRHAVFYQIFDDRVEILRVLHVSSEIERWL